MRKKRSRVRVERKVGEEFWTVKGIRQGCSLSPLFFNILIADLEEELAKVRRARVKIKGSRVYSLAYTDDVVLVAEEEEKMRSMLERLEIYLENKGLVLNVKKTKVMRFRKGGGRKGNGDRREKGWKR